MPTTRPALMTILPAWRSGLPAGRCMRRRKRWPMPSNLPGHLAWKRLRCLEPREAGDRLRQELDKRVDFLRYRFPLGFGRVQGAEPSSPLGKFFFVADELPAIIALFLERFPGEVERT